MKTKTFFAVSILLVLALTLSACGAKEADQPTPTPVDVNAIAAQAIQTFSMQMTMTAFAQPTATFTPIPLPTNTAAPTFVILTTNTAAAPTSSCNSSQWISDVSVPDGTPMAPGQQFTKTWLVKNSGTCTWTPNFKVSFGGIGVPMSGQSSALGKTVKPGEQVEISVNLVAPSTAGDVQSYWKLQDETGAFFGTWLTVVIKVAGTPAKTITPTEEVTPTATSGL